MNKVAPVDISRLYSELDLVHPRVVAASQLSAVLLKLFLAQVRIVFLLIKYVLLF